MAGRGLKVYIDMMSQPSRTVLWFCKIANLPHEACTVQIAKRQHKTPEYMTVHPFGQLPSIDDNGFTLFESHAILRYLAQAHRVPGGWYPSDDVRQRARIDRYLDWHHINTRAPCSEASFKLGLGPRMGLALPTASSAERMKKGVEACLDSFERVWLRSSPYLAGDEVSIADLSAMQELVQLKVIKYDYGQRPRLLDWMRRMEQLPHYGAVIEVLNKVVAKL